MNEVAVLDILTNLINEECIGCAIEHNCSPDECAYMKETLEQLSAHYDKLAYDKAVGCLPMKVDKVIGHLAHNAIISDMEHELAIAFNQKEVKNG